MSDRARTGQRAEDLAAAHLQAQGWQLLFRNWRRPQGELDIVARTPRGTCVFVEVRSRTGEDRGHPLEMVTAHKRRQVIRTARLFLSEESVAASGYRFDVIGVTFAHDPGEPPTFVHVEDAFEVA